MADQWVELVLNAPDRKEMFAFAERFMEALPSSELVIGRGPDIPVGAPRPTRYVVSALVGDAGGSTASSEAAREAVSDTLADLGVSVDSAPAPRDLLVVYI
jgi:hypothetical protein